MWVGMGENRRRVELLNIPYGSIRRTPIGVRVRINETSLVTLDGKTFGEKVMRSVFQIEIKVDIDSTDDERRAAFMRLVTEAAQSLYGTAAMLAKKPPIININTTDRSGKTEIPLLPPADVSGS
jgi:hypothetical protein